MRLYSCQYCSLTLYYDSSFCVRCRSVLGYWAETDTLGVLEPVPGQSGIFACWSVPGQRLRRCDNHRYDVCSWMVDADGPEAFCTACRHNLVVPDETSVSGRAGWRKLEAAKHRLFVALHRLGLIAVIERAGVDTLGFLFLEDPPAGPPIMTGHAFGKITIAVKEADDVEREQRRHAMREPYRTLLGHFRHESAHYFWDRLVRDRAAFGPYRAVFGNETEDYQEAVQRYYLLGPPSAWQEEFVSAYASMHPWEDFAETWAHYLHMVAALDTAHAYGLRTAPPVDRFGRSHIPASVDPFGSVDIDDLIALWMPLTTLMNSLNGAVGRDDAYPFVLSSVIVQKLGYVHRLIKEVADELAINESALLLRVGRGAIPPGAALP